MSRGPFAKQSWRQSLPWVNAVDHQTPSIWIDLDNSPHVPLFAPIIEHYRQQGVDVILTAREHSQTIELLELHGLAGTYKPIGKHYGGNKLAKAWGLLVRASKLVSYIANLANRPMVAVSHGSRAMVVAANWLKIPALTMYDYEFTETSIFNRFSDKVLVPDRLPDDVLKGVAPAKLVQYAGIKEELYIRNFHIDSNFRSDQLGVSENKILAILRPPATTANYHNDKSSVLLDDVMRLLLSAKNIFIIMAPRTQQQASEMQIAALNLPDARDRYTILKEAVDGLQLASAADLLISGGGTMNREAALLGVPVYSIFAGRQGALDRAMEAEGLITFIRDVRDLSKIRLERRDRARKPNALTDRVEKSVIEQIDLMLAGKS
jgi:predicted glycosyltransferase